MKKAILNLKGVQELSKNSQKSINGGLPVCKTNYCISDSDCYQSTCETHCCIGAIRDNRDF